ncbi:MAG: signal peptidase I [Vulcanimicrobiaceae bacterium]
MTPTQLLILVAIIVVVRAVVTLRPVPAGADNKGTAFAREYLDPFIVAGVAAWLLITFVARTYYIPSGSMLPTLQIHDVLLVNKFEYRFHQPQHGDIVVFPPPLPEDDDFIKRVIGVPGDKISIHGGVVYRNGDALQEPYIAAQPDYKLEIRDYGIYVDDGGGFQPIDPHFGNVPPKAMWTAPDRIPPNCYLMLGDNRNDSEDSHIWGFAQDAGTFATGPRAGQRAGFTGRAVVVFWPVTEARALQR